MPITPSDYNNDVIKGEQLARLTGKVLDKVKEKQDIINAEFDDTNGMLVLNNIDINVVSSTQENINV